METSATQIATNFLGPAMALMVVIVCLGTWIVTGRGYMLALALGCLLAIAAGITQIMPWLPSFGASIVLSNAMYTTAVLIAAEAVLRRSGLRIGIGWDVLFVVVSTALNAYFYFVTPHFQARVYIQCFGAGFVLIVTALALSDLARGRWWDKLVFTITLLYGLEHFPRAVLSSWGAPVDTKSAFSDPLYWQTLQFSSTVFAAGFILSVTVAAMLDYIEGLRHERDLDRLTGVLNRRGFEERTAIAMKRETSVHTLIVCDLDHFKRVNDTHGHVVGDQVLAIFGNLLRVIARDHDLVGRIGGEEFAVVLPDGGLAEAGRFVSRLQQRLAEADFPVPSGSDPIAASIGVAERKSEESFLAWFDRADAALYRAKEEGRNRAVFVGEIPVGGGATAQGMAVSR